MIIGLRRSVLISTIGIIASVIVLLPSILGLAFPLPSALPIAISNIELVDKQEDGVVVQVQLEVSNPNDMALTIAKIDYDLFADGKFVKRGQLDYTSIPVASQPVLLSGQSTTLKSTDLIDDSNNTNLFRAGSLPDLHWKVSGTIEFSNSFITGQREFTAYYS